MFTDYLTIVWRNLRERGLRSVLTMIGIFIGIATVVALVSLGQGLQDAIRQEFLSLGANTITVQPKGQGFGPPGTLAATKLTEEDRDEVETVKGVDSAFGRLIKPVEVEFNDEREVVFVATLPEEREDREYLYDARDIQVERGTDLEPDSRLEVLVGNRYYREKVFDRRIRPGDKLELNGTTVDVSGVLKNTGSPEIDISFQINEDSLREILGIEEEYSAIIARAAAGTNVSLVAKSIERALRNFRNVDKDEQDFTVETSQELLEQFSSVITIVQAVLVGIAAISLLVGGIGIMNTMFTSVLERTREIGIMKSIGATRRDILAMFLIESGLLGLIGGIVGIALGAVLSQIVEYLVVNLAGFQLLQASYPWYLIVGALFFSIAIGMASGTVPAVRASRMDPVEALEE